MSKDIVFLIFAGIHDNFANWENAETHAIKDIPQSHLLLTATLEALLNPDGLVLLREYRSKMNDWMKK